MLESARDVIRCLVTYNDWWQPRTGSVTKMPSIKRKDRGDGLHANLLQTLDERTELCRRMKRLSDRDRSILFLFYVRQLHVDDIAGAVGISRRQCFRRRNMAVSELATAGDGR